MKHRDSSWSYSSHAEHELSLSLMKELPSCYVNPRSIDAWRHERMYTTIAPLLQVDPNATWVTIGDGRFGSDAYFLIRHGINTMATSLTDNTLTIAKRHGFIHEFKSINAENIALPDNSYDYVLCKEACHHVPRPPIAIYEMLRVAKKAVILIEPQEENSKRLLRRPKDLIKKVVRKQKSTLFEPSGNYIFRISHHEITKMMTAIGYPTMATKRLNDFYHPRLADKKYALLSFQTLATKLAIAVQDALCFLKMLDFGLATIILFKVSPTANLVSVLKKHGYRVNSLPRNPYLQH